jgi:broad specificity phosphatase PhoE
VYLVRHGENDDDLPPHRHTGWLPIGLNNVGIGTAERLRDRFASVRPLLIVSSPLRRAMETATIIADADAAVTVIAEPRLGPWKIGDLAGQLESDTEHLLNELQRAGDVLPPGPLDDVETWDEFTTRVYAAMADMLKNISAEFDTIFLTHSWDGLLALEYLADEFGLYVPTTGEKPRPGDVFCLTVDTDGRVLALEDES